MWSHCLIKVFILPVGVGSGLVGDPHCTQDYKGSSVNKNILGTRYYAPCASKEDLHIFTPAYSYCGLLRCAQVVPECAFGHSH